MDQTYSTAKSKTKEYWTSKTIERLCPLCGYHKNLLLSRRMQYGYNLHTVICQKCGFVFTNPMPEKTIYDAFYVNEYYRSYDNISNKLSEEVTKDIPPILQTRLEKISGFLPLPGKRLLEIGPGHGHFLYWAKQMGAEILGVETSDEFLKQLKDFDLACIRESFENLNSGELGKFDFIVMAHVLEHMLDPNQALQKTKALFCENGLLVIEVPNIRRPYRSLDNFFLRYVHPSNFSPNTLRSFLNKHGFEILFFEEEKKDWRYPENLFVIAKQSKEKISIQQSDHYRQVFWSLTVYRIHWYLWMKWKWMIYTRFVKTKRYIKSLLAKNSPMELE